MEEPIRKTDQFLIDARTYEVLLEECDGKSEEGLRKETGLKPGVLKKIRDGKSVNLSTAIKVAVYLEVELQAIGEPLAVRLDSRELYSILGLTNLVRAISDEHSFFQTFELNDLSPRPELFQNLPPINNPLSYNWTDVSARSHLKAYVLSTDANSHLRIEFETAATGLCGNPFASNIAIHPQWLSAVEVDTTKYRFLDIPFRVPASEGESHPLPIRLGVRVRDKKLRQWLCGKPDYTSVRYESKSVPEDWNVARVDLRSNQWSYFDFSNRPMFTEPLFSTITSVILEVGCAGAGRRPSSGYGIVDIGAIGFSKR